MAAEKSRLRQTAFPGVFSKLQVKTQNVDSIKIAPHPISGHIPITSIHQQKQASDPSSNGSQQSEGLPYKGIFTRRNNLGNNMVDRDRYNMSATSNFYSSFAASPFPQIGYLSPHSPSSEQEKNR